MKHFSSFLAGTILLTLVTGAQAQVPTFSSSSFAVSGVNGAYAVASGDFDGNGKPDLAVANYSTGSVTIWLGDGAGGYTEASGSPITASAGVSALAVTDLNGDGKADLVAVMYQSSGTNAVYVWLGHGNGTFQAFQQFSAGSGSDAVVVGDFNRDGKPDLAIANFLSNTVSVFLNSTSTGASAVLFNIPAGSPFAAGSSPASITIADFDGDGNLDMAIADDVASGKVTVLLGNASGIFSAASYSPINVGAFVFSVVAADFNGDGKPDLAIASFGNDFLIVMLGSGSGFTEPVGGAYTTGHAPISVTTGDFNGDGNLDLATANYGGGNVSVFLGNGSGAFTAASGNPFSVGTNPQFLITGDFNLDGEPDLAVAVFGSNKMTLLLNTSPAITANPASATFWAELSGGSPVAAVSIVSGGSGYTVNDFLFEVAGAHFRVSAVNGGGVVTSIVPVSVGQGYFVGQSLGFFGGTGSGLTAIVTAVGEAGFVPAPASVPVTVNSTGTGFSYNAASNQAWLTPSPASNATGSSSTVTLSASQGTMPAGTYSATARYTSPHFFGGKTTTVLNVSNPSGTLASGATVNLSVPTGLPSSVAVGDFNLDGKPDLAVAIYAASGNTVNVLLGDGAGGFNTPGSSFPAVAFAEFVAVGDFNRDGKPDLVLASDQDSGAVTVLLGDGAGNFAPAPGSPLAVGGRSVAIGDFNGDGKPDLAVASLQSNHVTILLGNGLGGFAPAPVSPIVLQGADFVAVGDFNGDGKQDLAALGNDGVVAVLLGNGVGGFAPALNSPFQTGHGPQTVVVADFNGDGKQDLATANSGDNTVSVLLGDGAGGFNPALNSPFSAGPNPQSLVVADLNGDGKPDLAVADYDGPPYSATILLGNGSGGFSQAVGSPFPAGNLPAFVATGDFNRDGKADLAVLNNIDGTISVLLGALAPTYPALSGTSQSTFGTTLTFTAAFSSTGFNPLTGNVELFDGASPVGAALLPASSLVASVSSAGGAIEINAPGHGLSTGQTLSITGVNGTTEANGIWTATVLDAGHFTLSFSTFTHAYTGGGRVQPAAQLLVSGLSVGGHPLHATYSGDGRNASTSSGERFVTIVQAPQDINFPAMPDVSYGVVPFPINATVNSPLTIQFSPGTAGVCSVSGNLVTILGPGLCTITASQPGDADYHLAPPVTRGFHVTFTPASLALGQPATQSSTYGNEYASLAADGNADGNFSDGSVSTTNNDVNAWWQVDLGAPAAVNSIAIWNRTDCCGSRLSDYWVFVSNTPFLASDTPATLSGRAGTFSSHQTSAPAPNATIAIGAQGRYVRVQLSGTGYLSLAEVQVFGTIPDVALGQTATQSSTYGFATASLAIDGNTDGSFSDNSVSTTNMDANAWWQVDLGASAAVNSITIWNRTDCCGSRLSDYWVFVSNTPFLASDTPATLSGRAGTFSSHQTSVPAPNATVAIGVHGRYVRVQLSSPGYLSLAEVQVLATTGDLALGEAATQSSTFGSSTASLAVDGNTDGNFYDNSISTTNMDANSWWQVDLGASAAANSIAVWNRTDCCGSRLSDYWVFVSNTPFLASDTPATLSARAGTFSSHQTSAPSPNTYIAIGAQGRYVRVQLSSPGYLSLAEVQVFGTIANVAQGQVATQSSTYGAETASLAVDGNTDGNFSDNSVSTTNGDANAWWEVDLGASATVNSIVVWNRADCCGSRLGDYWVFVSDTPFLASDTPATLSGRAGTFSSHQTAAPSPSSRIVISGAEGRYVRVQLSDTDYLSLAEVQVFGTLVPTTDVASGQRATQSSTYGAETASLAVDGSTDGNFSDNSVSTTNLDTNAWWEVDLGAPVTVSSVVVWNRTDCCEGRLSDYWVFVSDTPFLSSDTPTTLSGRAGTFSSHQTTAPAPSANVAIGGPGRYVRVQLSNPGYLSLAEVQVFSP